MAEHVVVLGAGVIGLTCAVLIAEAGYSVEVVARDLPGDSSSQGFASPWAGANWHSFCTGENERMCRWEMTTCRKMWDEMIPQGLAMKLQSIDYYESPPPSFWFKDFSPDYRELKQSELPSNSPNAKAGVTYTSWSVNAPEYIKWLAFRLEGLNVPITRGTVVSIEEPFFELYSKSTPATIVVNATALGARTLRGVEDTTVIPVRGQTVIVRAPHLKKCIGLTMDDSSSPPTYIIPRPNGDCVLGGTAGFNDWTMSSDQQTTESIVKRCHALEPSLSPTGGGPETIPIIKANVGFRPVRVGGARLEKETITVPLASEPFKPSMKYSQLEGVQSRKVDVVHAYGIGPAGFQASWGMATDVLALVVEIIRGRNA